MSISMTAPSREHAERSLEGHQDQLLEIMSGNARSGNINNATIRADRIRNNGQAS
jgi:hypothetical protein